MSPATYSSEQVHQIYDRLQLPATYRLTPDESGRKAARGDDGLAYLTVLQRYHIASVPFESLELHYSPTKVINTDAELLFDKIVTQNTNRGGYCMENNLFFGTLLRSLGFSVMSVGGRVNKAPPPIDDAAPQESFTGWSHMINIVTIQGTRYMVDVGFGNGQPTHPLDLVDRSPSMNVRPNQQVRLRWDATADAENKSAKVWIFERQDKLHGPWIPAYCFPDNVEFLPQDFQVMNYFTSTHRTSFFTQNLIAAKYLLNESGDEVIGNLVIVGKSAHKRVHGVKEDLATFENEEERIQALEKYFGIRLSKPQKAGILGLGTAI